MFYEIALHISYIQNLFPEKSLPVLQIGPEMMQSRHFIKTACTGKISQISKFQNLLQKKSNLHTFTYLSELIQKNKQFAMTDPVVIKSILLLLT